MQLKAKWFSFGRTAKLVLALVMVLLVLALSAFAGCSTLHHALHPDSDSPHHQCLISVFANGQLSGAETIAIVVLIGIFAVYAELPSGTPARSLFDYRFAPSRAPPRR